MNRRTALIAISASLFLAGLTALAGDAAAQGAKSLIGPWTLISAEDVDASGKKTPVFDSNPRGFLIFTSNGRYSLWYGAPSLPKFASNSRAQGTAEENKAVVLGSLAHFGKYTVDKKGKVFTFHVETSTYPNWDGTTQKRYFTVSGDELKFTNPVGSATGARVDLVWKRAK